MSTRELAPLSHEELLQEHLQLLESVGAGGVSMMGDAHAAEAETLRNHNALLRATVAQVERDNDVLRAALEGLLNALPSATAHPAIKAARAALAQEPA